MRKKGGKKQQNKKKHFILKKNFLFIYYIQFIGNSLWHISDCDASSPPKSDPMSPSSCHPYRWNYMPKKTHLSIHIRNTLYECHVLFFLPSHSRIQNENTQNDIESNVAWKRKTKENESYTVWQNYLYTIFLFGSLFPL